MGFYQDCHYKNYLCIIFIIVVLVLVISYISYLINYSNLRVDSVSPLTSSFKSNVSQSIPSICSNLSSEQLDSCIISNSNCSEDSCYYKRAILRLSSDDCMKIKDNNLLIKCNSIVDHNLIFTNSVSLNNVNLCNNLSDSETIIACKNNYYYVQSYNLGNKSLCNLITNENFKNECLSK